MAWWEWFVLGSGFALEFSIIVFVLRWRIWRSFPAYSIYIVFVHLRDLLLTATLSHPQTYFLIFWFCMPVDILLTILATLESFWRVLRSFQLLRWFRFVLPTVILAALAYSAWTGYRFPPVEASSAGAAIIHATMTSHYVILSIVILYFLLVAFFQVSWRIHEHRLILGFGAASLAFAFGGAVRAVFGSHAAIISRQAPPIGYLIALLIWLSAVIYPVPEKISLPAPSAEMLEHLKFQLRNFRSFVRKDGR